MTNIKLYNTLSKQIESLKSSDSTFKIFMCGPTVYGDMHAGHAKTYIQFDFLTQYLRSQLSVQYLMNITDIDDKIITKANAENVDYRVIATTFKQRFFNDMTWLGNKYPDLVLDASLFISEIIDQIKRLITDGFAYQLDDGWYFDSLKARNYHSLANNPVGVPGDDNRKHSSSDFVLWKFKKSGEPFWETELGDGRPGWHIEDTAITESVFGPHYDMHGGALDLVFPHHEAEIAIMETLSNIKPLASHWVHTGLLLVDGAKMSKSLDNFTTVNDLKNEGWSPETIRYMFFTSHYRSSSEVSNHALAAAEGARKRVEAFYRTLLPNSSSKAAETRLAEVRSDFFTHLNNDFDTPKALDVLFSYMKEVNKDNTLMATSETKAFLKEINEFFKLFIFETETLSSEIELQIDRRNIFRKAKNFEEADKIRRDLEAQGIFLEDTPQRTLWHRTTPVNFG